MAVIRNKSLLMIYAAEGNAGPSGWWRHPLDPGSPQAPATLIYSAAAHPDTDSQFRFTRDSRVPTYRDRPNLVSGDTVQFETANKQKWAVYSSLPSDIELRQDGFERPNSAFIIEGYDSTNQLVPHGTDLDTGHMIKFVAKTVGGAVLLPKNSPNIRVVADAALARPFSVYFPNAVPANLLKPVGDARAAAG